MSPDHFQEILQLCEPGPADERGFRPFPKKTTLSLYLAKQGVPLTVGAIEAVALKGENVHARTSKGDLYIFSLQDLFAANIEGAMQVTTPRKAGFG
ncbi:MAG: hypothetical protein NVS3B20_08100 [Polyangiales bacterium]